MYRPRNAKCEQKSAFSLNGVGTLGSVESGVFDLCITISAEAKVVVGLHASTLVKQPGNLLPANGCLEETRFTVGRKAFNRDSRTPWDPGPLNAYM